MKIISKDNLSTYAESQDINSYLVAFSNIKKVIVDSIDSVKQSNIIISNSNFEITPINSFSNATATGTSELDLMISSDCLQLEANSLTLKRTRWQSFKKSIFEALRNLKRKNRRKKNKQKKGQTNNLAGDLTREETPYNIESFKYDIFNELKNHLSQLTVIYYQDRRLHLLSKSDLQLNVNLYFSIKSGNKNKTWSESNNRFYYINVEKIYEKTQQEQKKKGENFTKIFTILNNLYFLLNKRQPPNFLIESIMFSIPKELLLKSELTNAFNASINFLINNPTSFIEKEEYAEYTDFFPYTDLKTEKVLFLKNIAKNIE